MFNKLISRGVVLVAVMAFALLGVLSPSNVAFAGERKFSDNFNHTYLQPDHRSKWWIINAAYDPSTNSQGFYENFCGPDSCFLNMQEGEDRFARLELYPGNTPGYFVNVDVAEEHTGYQAEIENKWLPTVGNNVEMTTKVRWDSSFNQQGTGGARGTSGVWLWDSPYDFANYDPEAPLNSFGFNYAPYDTLGGFAGGLKITALSGGFPVILTNFPVAIDMTQWNEFKFVWSVDSSGVQSLAVSVNGQDAGTYALPFPLPALSTEIWLDNEFASFDEFGGLDLSYEVLQQQVQFDLSEYTVRYVSEE